jgi:hypothetical protein
MQFGNVISSPKKPHGCSELHFYNSDLMIFAEAEDKCPQTDDDDRAAVSVRIHGFRSKCCSTLQDESTH